MLRKNITKAGGQSARLSLAQSRAERAVRATFDHVRTTLDTADVLRQLVFGNYEGAIDAMVKPFQAMGDSLAQVYLNAASTETENIGQQIGQHVSFNPTTMRVVTDMRNLRAFFVQDLNATMRDAMRDIVMNGLQNSRTPEDILQSMKGGLGLTSRDLNAIENYRQGVLRGERAALTTPLRDRRYDRALRENRPLGDAAIERMVAAKIRLTRQVSLTRLARTESLRAINMGRHALIQQLIDSDAISAENMQRTWNATMVRTRDSHAAQSGETRGPDEAFSNGLMYPGDPNGAASEVINCNCWLRFDVQPG